MPRAPMKAMRSATRTIMRRAPPTQAALFPELSGGNEAQGTGELSAEVTACACLRRRGR